MKKLFLIKILFSASVIFVTESRWIECGAGFFKCSSDGCISMYDVCDCRMNCRDGSDDENCHCKFYFVLMCVCEKVN